MMTQVNEVEKDKHMKALMVEFFEAFGRACDKLSYPEFVRYLLAESSRGGKRAKFP
jgi:hypothetical protein